MIRKCVLVYHSRLLGWRTVAISRCMDELREAKDCAGCRRLERLVEQLRQQVAQLQQRLEEALRSGKRQAAPFSRNQPKPRPRQPGRKAGDAHGQHHHRSIPTAEQINETHAVPLPARCPHCESTQVEPTRVVQQYQVELPVHPIYRRFDIQQGRCQGCHRSVTGRHPLQTSMACGAAASQLGPRLQAFLTLLQKRLGLSYGKCKQLLFQTWQISVSRGGVVKVVQRVAERVTPALPAIRQALRTAPYVEADETGWRLGGRSAWLHVLCHQQAVLYQIAPSRSAKAAAAVLGWKYAGTLVHDGFRSYDRFTRANHQSCLFHVLRRCRQLLEDLTPTQGAWVKRIKERLQEALQLKHDLREGRKVCQDRHAEAAWQKQQLLRILSERQRKKDKARLGRWLRQHLSHLFTFLHSEVPATSSGAEQAIRPAVVNRKVWGGNRTKQGAKVQSTLMSLLGTLALQRLDALDYLSKTLCQGFLPLEFGTR